MSRPLQLGPGPAGRAVRSTGWAVLALLLLANVLGAVTLDRSRWPGLVGDEATYAMQAASLAFDADLAYERRDYDRFVADWGRPPEGLILQSRTAGARMTYGKAFPYALAVAPFVLVAPVHGPLVANALFLAVAALLAAAALSRRLGPAAPLWVAVLVFASVTFGYTYWVHADLFLLSCTAAGLALLYLGEPKAVLRSFIPEVYQPPRGAWEMRGGWRPALRWLLAGMLLAVPAAFRPLYLGLLLPALPVARAEAAEEREGAGRRLVAFALGALLVLGGTALVQWSAGGDWSPYGGERRGFYERTGFPEVDFQAVGGWEESIRRWGNTSWLHEGAVTGKLELLDAGLWGWNAVYFLAGRDVGVLPYFLPLVLGLGLAAGLRGRWTLPLAVLVAVVGFLWLRPFNFYGGAGALANRYFLPLYPALWFLAGRAPAERDATGRRRAAAALLVAAAAAPFLWPLWTAPRAYPVVEGRYHHVSGAAVRLLPYETTQSHVPGGQDRVVGDLWVKVLARAEARDDGTYRLTGGGAGQLLVGATEPVESVFLAFAPGAPAELPVDGGEVVRTVLAPDGGVALLVDLDDPSAVHPMWWTAEDFHLYRIDLGPADGAVVPPFTIRRGGTVDIRPSGDA